MAGMLDYTTEPRWTYNLGRKTSNPAMMERRQWPGVMEHTEIKQYDLPKIDVQTARRNFDGYTETQYVTAEMLTDAVGDVYGSTDTDTYTEAGSEKQKNYTKINRRSGPSNKWMFSASAKRAKSNS